ncbi:hypothetical protein HAX54_020652 [Datura stramonium]|uniref:Uncharacterized protein n=1 Tax=Datura stramonium TaxID=4076 RepID=A0ABS8S650_DATST|nr:hypothetical protein [Datura stramonium]
MGHYREFYFWVFFQEKGLLSFLDGASKIPTDEIDKEAWIASNTMVIGWMIWTHLLLSSYKKKSNISFLWVVRCHPTAALAACLPLRLIHTQVSPTNPSSAMGVGASSILHFGALSRNPIQQHHAICHKLGHALTGCQSDLLGSLVRPKALETEVI